MLVDAFRCHDPHLERAFLVDYGRIGVVIDVVAASLGLASSLLKPLSHSILLKPVISHGTAAMLGSSWLMDATRVALCTFIILLVIILGRQRYTLLRGAISTVYRAVYALGVPLTVRPGLCRFCGLLWHQRLMIINMMCVLSRIPSRGYWLGGAVSCALAALIHAADPNSSCRQSVGCTVDSLWELSVNSISSPLQTLQHVLQPSVVTHAAVYLAGLLIPGSLLTWMECKARRKWLLYHSVQQPSGHQQQLQEQQATAEADEQQKRSTKLQAMFQQPRQETQHRQEGTRSQESQQQPQTRTSPRSSHPFDSNSNEATLRDSAASSHPLLYSSPNMTYLFTVNHLLNLDEPSSSHAASTSAPAVPAAPVNQHVYQSPIDTQMYSFKFATPQGARAESLQDFRHQLQQHLEAQLEAFTAHPNSPVGGNSTVTPSPVRPLVTQCAAFPGCYQIVFQVVTAAEVTSAAAGLASAASAAAVAQHMCNSSIKTDAPMRLILQDSAQQFLQRWPGWRLLSVQFEQQCAISINSLTTAVCEAALAGAATRGDSNMVQPRVALQRYVQPLMRHSPRRMIKHLVSSREASTFAATVGLLLQQAVVDQLLQQGHQHIRVVITRQPTGQLVLDQAYQLQQGQLQDHQATQQTLGEETGIHPKHSGRARSTTVGSTSEWRTSIDLSGAMDTSLEIGTQPQVLSVVILAGNRPCHDCSVPGQCGHNSKQSPATAAASSTDPAAAPEAVDAAGSSNAAGYAAGTTPQCGVLAQLPLLFLPPEAAQEFAQLLSTLQGVGLRAEVTQQLLLPVVRDLAAVLARLSPRDYSASGRVSNSSIILQVREPEPAVSLMTHALLSWFEGHNMVTCSRMLQSVLQQHRVEGVRNDPAPIAELTAAAGAMARQQSNRSTVESATTVVVGGRWPSTALESITAISWPEPSSSLDPRILNRIVCARATPLLTARACA